MKKTAHTKPTQEFPYQLEYCLNPDVIKLNTRSRFPSHSMALLGLKHVKKMNGKKKSHPLFRRLRRIEGLISASSGDQHFDSERKGPFPHYLQVEKTASFAWELLLPRVLHVVQRTVARKRVLMQVGEPKVPDYIMNAVHRITADGEDF